MNGSSLPFPAAPFPAAALPALVTPVAGYAAVMVSPRTVSGLRRSPGKAPGLPISPSLLKHADPQSVAALAAVLQAIQDHGLAQVNFQNWGAIAGPALLGRQASIDSMARYRQEGAFGISPHLIPYESLHAVSGAISQVLKIHGPNLGVGGGPSAAEETLLVAATLLAECPLDGLWVVLTEFDPELVPVESGQTGGDWTCHAVALALRPAALAARYDLTIVPPVPAAQRMAKDGLQVRPMEAPCLRVSALAAALTERDVHRSWRLSCGASVSLRPRSADASADASAQGSAHAEKRCA